MSRCNCKYKEKCWVHDEGRCDTEVARNPNCYEYMILEEDDEKTKKMIKSKKNEF